MKLTKGLKTKYCGTPCLTDDMKGSYFIVADFMLGDADSYLSEIQGSYKKLSKEMIKIVLALEASLGKNTEDMFCSEFLNTPYSESSYWSFEGYKVLFLDKENNVFEVSIEFEGDEIYFLNSEKIQA